MSSTTRLKGSPAKLRYGIALIGVALATAVRLSLSGLLGARFPFTAYFIASIFVAIYCGLGPALLTIALGALIGAYSVCASGPSETSGLIMVVRVVRVSPCSISVLDQNHPACADESGAERSGARGKPRAAGNHSREHRRCGDRNGSGWPGHVHERQCPLVDRVD